MELSLFLAKIFGLYIVIVCSAAFLRRRQFEKLMHSFAGNSALIIFSGAVFLILGLAAVVSHNVWVADWRVIITLLGWLTLFKAGMRLFFPEQAGSMAVRYIKTWPVIFPIFLALGLYLLYAGFSY